MKKIGLSLLAAGACLGATLPNQPTATQETATSNTFAREPVIVYTNEVLTSSGPESSSLIAYQDGFVTASRSGAVTTVRSGNIGSLKISSWTEALLQLGAGRLPDGPTPDPTGPGAATLTVLRPRTEARAHTFSYGPGDYPEIEGLIAAMFLRLNV